MTRSLVLIPILLAACSVGEYGKSNNVTPDGQGGGDGPAGGDRNLCADTNPAPLAAYVHTGADGGPATPRAGLGCMDVGCHAAGGAGGEYAFAGTVYKDTAGTTPRAGVTVRIFPLLGSGDQSVAKAVTDDAGNFYITGSFAGYPYTTDVTGCGLDNVANGIRPMVGNIPKNSANCNLGGTCHGNPGGTTPIYLLD